MATETINLGFVKSIFVGTSAPSNLKVIWYDDNPGQKVHKAYNTVSGQWEIFGGSTPDLQSVTSAGNTSSNAIVVTGIGGVDFSSEGLYMLYNPGTGSQISNVYNTNPISASTLTIGSGSLQMSINAGAVFNLSPTNIYLQSYDVATEKLFEINKVANYVEIRSVYGFSGGETTGFRLRSQSDSSGLSQLYLTNITSSGSSLANISTQTSGSFIGLTDHNDNQIVFQMLDSIGHLRLNSNTSDGISLAFFNNTEEKNIIYDDGRISGANAINNNEFVTLSQLNSFSPSLTLQNITENGNTTDTGIVITGQNISSFPNEGGILFYDPNTDALTIGVLQPGPVFGATFALSKDSLSMNLPGAFALSNTPNVFQLNAEPVTIDNPTDYRATFEIGVYPFTTSSSQNKIEGSLFEGDVTKSYDIGASSGGSSVSVGYSELLLQGIAELQITSSQTALQLRSVNENPDILWLVNPVNDSPYFRYLTTDEEIGIRFIDSQGVNEVIVNIFYKDGRVSGSDATNSNEFVTLGQMTSAIPTNMAWTSVTGIPQIIQDIEDGYVGLVNRLSISRNIPQHFAGDANTITTTGIGHIYASGSSNLPINENGALYTSWKNDSVNGGRTEMFISTASTDSFYFRRASASGNWGAWRQVLSIEKADTIYSKIADFNTFSETYLKGLAGYDGGATQTLKNISGVLTWVTD